MPVVLHPNSLKFNIQRSLRAYMQAMATAEGLRIHHERDRNFQVGTTVQWVSWSSALLDATRGHRASLDGTCSGSLVQGFFEVTLAERVAARTDADAFWELRDIVYPYVCSHATVPIYDYTTLYPPAEEVGRLFFDEPRERLINTGDVSGIAEYLMSMPADRWEITTF